MLLSTIVFGLAIDTGSTSFGNWAMWVGALGTISTLVFLIRQNQLISQRQDRVEAEERKSKQLQLAELRKKSFYDLLDELENYSNPAIHFERKLKLYSSIYSTPKLSDIGSPKLPLVLRHNTEFLEEIKTTCFSILEHMRLLEKNTSRHQHITIFELLKLLSCLHAQLNLKLTEPVKDGHVIDLKLKIPVINLFHISRDIASLWDAVNYIFDFAEYDAQLPELNFGTSSDDQIKIGLIKSAGVGSYRLQLPHTNRQVTRTLCTAYDVLFYQQYVHQNDANALNFECVGFLIGVFSSEEQFFSVIEDTEAQLDLFTSIKDDLDHYLFMGDLPRDKPHKYSQLYKQVIASLEELSKSS